MAGLNRLSAASRSEGRSGPGSCRSRATIPIHGRLSGEDAVRFIQRVETLLAAGMAVVECDVSPGVADWCTVSALLKASHLARLRGGTLVVHTDDPAMRSTLRARGLAPLVA